MPATVEHKGIKYNGINTSFYFGTISNERIINGRLLILKRERVGTAEPSEENMDFRPRLKEATNAPLRTEMLEHENRYLSLWSIEYVYCDILSLYIEFVRVGHITTLALLRYSMNI